VLVVFVLEVVLVVVVVELVVVVGLVELPHGTDFERVVEGG